jgi:hypothetical protein
MTRLTKQRLQWLAGIAAAALTVGCSSGSRNDVEIIVPVAQAPQVLGTAAVALDQDTTSAPQAIRVVDADTPISQVVLTIATSDATIVPVSGVRVDGNGFERMVSITPTAEATGTATVTLTARDPGGLVGMASFDVRVNPVLVSFRTLTTSSFNMPDDGMFGRVSGVTVQSDADDDAQAFDALLQAGVQ